MSICYFVYIWFKQKLKSPSALILTSSYNSYVKFLFSFIIVSVVYFDTLSDLTLFADRENCTSEH